MLRRLLVLGVLLGPGCGPNPDGPGAIDGASGADGGTSGADAPIAVDAPVDGAGRGFGELCTDKRDCLSNICIFAGVSGVCSSLCAEGTCPAGWGCYGVLGAVSDGVVDDVCVPDTTQLCSPCTDSTECGLGVNPNVCVTYGDGSQFCGRDCSSIECPTGYECVPVTVGASTYDQCVPLSGACDCDAGNLGEVRSCALMTPFGACTGQRVCGGAAGWGMCEPPSMTDVPDGTFTDANCDGIDGDIGGGIFVAVSGVDDAACGLVYGDPCRNINYGILRALGEGRGHVYVQAGVYNEVVTLSSSIDVWGGYDLLWQRAARTVAGHETRIVGQLDSASGQYLAVKAHGLLAATILADVVIVGPDAAGEVGNSAKSSYGVHVDNSNELVLARVTIDAGNGATGMAGAIGQSASPVTTTPQMMGQSGGDAQEDERSCDIDDHGVGGAGGTNTCPGANGGRGGDGGTMDTGCACIGSACVCDPCSARPGAPGGNATLWLDNVYGEGGLGGSGGDACGLAGDGLDGLIQNGTAGLKGTAGGFLSGGYWYARAGGNGGTGAHGSGGGGGGGSGGCDLGIDSHGAGGGGGGAGGCAAISGGGRGKGGGGSFGLFALGSVVTVSDCEIIQGNGGTGGSGGIGGQGQSGEAGRRGGLADGDSKAGGRGGDGEHGGHSGGGGGGAGGISFGIYSYGSTITHTCTFSGGAPGAGGLGGTAAPAPSGERDGNPGQDGDPGTLGTVGTCLSPSGC